MSKHAGAKRQPGLSLRFLSHSLLLRIRLHSGFLNLLLVMTYSFDNKSCGPTPRNDSVQTLKLYISNLTFVVNMRRKNIGA